MGTNSASRSTTKIREASGKRDHEEGLGSTSWKLYVEGNGQTIPFDDPVDLCIAARQQLEKSHSVADIATFWKRNEATFRELRDKRQELGADDGRHYADFLLSLYAAKLQSLALLDAGSVAASEVNRATGTVRRRGASLPIKKTQRLRNPDHLRSVRTKPCLICGRVPSHAHHIRFAQPSAIARKVSDQWTVPLCSIHHDAVHQRGDERAWWKQEKIDPMTEAERLWRKSAGTEHSERAQISKPLNSAASVARRQGDQQLKRAARAATRNGPRPTTIARN